MKPYGLFCALALLFLCSSPCLGGAATEDIASARTAAASINRFAFDFYRTLLVDNKENIFFSPQSISSAMAMVYAGAVGQTKDEMQRVMYYGDKVHSQMSAQQKLISTTSPDAGVLEGANAVWPAVQYELLPEYRELVCKYYGAEVTTLDYVNGTNEAIGTINAWANAKTRGRIPAIVDTSSVTPDTTVVLTNAIYFRAQWAYEFDKSNTKKHDFFRTSKDIKKVDIMSRRGSTLYYETKHAQAIKLPYKDNAYSMLIILPKDKDGIGGLDKATSYAAFSEILSHLAAHDVRVFLPKFELETSYPDLVGNFQRLGMNRVFGDNSEITKIALSSHPFMISSIVHKAFCKVDEKETEAAAVTVIAMQKVSMVQREPQPFIFRADHPFLYFILDNRTDAILFMGRYMGP